METAFDRLYKDYQDTIQANRAKFESHDNIHVGQRPSEIFDTYWFLQGNSNQFEGPNNEKITLITQPPFDSLPDDLKMLFR